MSFGMCRFRTSKKFIILDRNSKIKYGVATFGRKFFRRKFIVESAFRIQTFGRMRHFVEWVFGRKFFGRINFLVERCSSKGFSSNKLFGILSNKLFEAYSIQSWIHCKLKGSETFFVYLKSINLFSTHSTTCYRFYPSRFWIFGKKTTFHD